ncbi:MAG: RNA pyrophosphohydrolase [Helicobacteraceae bacterium]|nr:RNA pyrophosphohydrolase [Helicobacteraceae bacterium]
MKKNYRPNVAAVVLSSEYPEATRILIAERSDIKGTWQFPQGGIDDGEDPQTALFRELGEEIGTSEAEIIAEYPDWVSYDFPSNVAKKMYPFDGQTQKYFLVRLKDSAAINIATRSPEFSQYKFAPIEDAIRQVSFFKRPIYKKVIYYFKKQGYL